MHRKLPLIIPGFVYNFVKACKWRGLHPKGLISEGAYIQGGLNPRGLISEEAYIGGGFLSEGAHIRGRHVRT